MKIEKLNENKIKIIFDYKELEENNISVHSFLSNSIESQKLFWAILDIANEDLGFDISNSKISYETISFDNKDFVIFVTKHNNLNSQNINDYLNITNTKNTNNLNTNNYYRKTINRNGSNYEQAFKNKKQYFSFLGDNLSNQKEKFFSNILLYKFENIIETFYFSDYAKKTLNKININSSLHKYKNSYFFKFDIENLKDVEKKLIISILAEFKNCINLSTLSLSHFEEFSEILIKNNAIQNL